MMNVVRFFLALVFTILMFIPFVAIGLSVSFLVQKDQQGEMGALIGSNAAIFIYVVSPAIFVGCFRFQHSKWKRFFEVLKTLVIVTVIGLVWKACTFTLFAAPLKNAPDISLALNIYVTIALMFFSGIYTSRALPIPNQPPLGQRPMTVRLFEYVFYAELCLGFIMTVIGYDNMMATIEEFEKTRPEIATFATPTFLSISAVLGALTMLAVVLLVTRRGSVMIRNTLVAVFLIGVVSTIGFSLHDGSIYQMSFGGQSTLHNALSILSYIGNIIAVILILTPSARKWINRESNDIALQLA